MTIVVLDYSDPCVEVFKLPDDYFEKELEKEEKDLSELIEDYLIKQGLNFSEINWMVSDEDVPVYYDKGAIPMKSL